MFSLSLVTVRGQKHFLLNLGKHLDLSVNGATKLNLISY
jgi:hypothetical protein